MAKTLEQLGHIKEVIEHVEHAFQITKNLDQKESYRNYIVELRLIL
jgi:hypothetical protein